MFRRPQDPEQDRINRDTQTTLRRIGALAERVQTELTKLEQALQTEGGHSDR